MAGPYQPLSAPVPAPVLQVKGSFFTVRKRRVLLDAAGQPVLSMHEKVNSPRGRAASQGQFFLCFVFLFGE